MISGLNSNTIDANTVGGGSVKGAHKRPDAQEMFKKMDSDGDGSVSEQEFESTMVSISPQGANAADSADAQARAEAEFKKTDTDGDGKVSESELAAGLQAHEAEHAGQTQAAGGKSSGASHGAAPAGGGGGGGGGNAQAQSASSSSSQTYDPADTNEDGKVSQQEAQAYAAKQAAEKAATAALKSYDEISSLGSGTQASQSAE